MDENINVLEKGENNGYMKKEKLKQFSFLGIDFNLDFYICTI